MAADWNPAAYARFGDLRFRPALDLLAQVGPLPAGHVIDLGCGSGAAGSELDRRFRRRQGIGYSIIGVDSSAAMLAQAAALSNGVGNAVYDGLHQADIALWAPHTPSALVFSNAALHWLPDHAALMPMLAGWLAPGGWLAVQMPRQYDQPSHRALRDVAAQLFPDRFDLQGWQAPVWPAAQYWDMLAPLGTVMAWETDYVQHLPATAEGHPVRAFTASTAMRPFVERLTGNETARYLAAYDEALAAAYPLRADGSVLMPFRRVFFTLQVP